MKIYLCISIDVEPDCSLNWHYSVPLAFTCVSRGIGEILHPLFGEFGIRPTYLLNNVVQQDDESVAVLKGLSGKYELGTHLHGDFIEPGLVHSDPAGQDGVMNQCFLDPAIEYGKLKNITSLFTERFGYAPVSFRAGRFSAGPNTIHSLTSLGYKVDTSITPKIIWNDVSRERPVDFTKAPDQPYWISDKSFPQPSPEKKLLEIPVSIVTTRKYGLLKRPLWLRPHYSTAGKMAKVWENLTQANPGKPVLVLNMMFHNVEVIPNLNPYTKSSKDVGRYLDSLRIFFDFCLKKNVQPATLSDIYNHLSAGT
jgi:hypothetical protein